MVGCAATSGQGCNGEREGVGSPREGRSLGRCYRGPIAGKLLGPRSSPRQKERVEEEIYLEGRVEI